jgi:hypothetical protein
MAEDLFKTEAWAWSVDAEYAGNGADDNLIDSMILQQYLPFF